MQQVFLVKEKKEHAPSLYGVPRHPEFIYIRKLSDISWHAKDAENGGIFLITRIENNGFYFYEVQKEH